MTSNQYWACKRKIKFKKEKNAKRMLKQIRKKGIIVPQSAVVYKCKYCTGWHVGHAIKGKEY